MQFHLNALHVVGCCVTALAIAVLAAFIPACRAMRLQVISALQYE